MSHLLITCYYFDFVFHDLLTWQIFWFHTSLGFLVGFLFATIMMSIVGSAVNTVIVCFAEAPAEFQANHPELSNEMRMTWRNAWPDVCGNM